MPSNAIYYLPPMPTRLVPPRIYAPIPDAIIGGDSPPINSRAMLNVILQLWSPPYFQRPSLTQVVTLLPPSLGAGDSPPFRLLGKLPQAILDAYKRAEHLHVPRTVVHLPIPVTQESTEPVPFTRHDLHIVSKWYHDKELALERTIYYMQRKYYYVTDNAAPTFTTGYLIAFQPDSFQVLYPSAVTSFQGMNRHVAIPLTSIREFLTVTIGPLMREYRAGNAVTIEFSIHDPSENPPLPYNPEAVYLNLYQPSGASELIAQSMQNISQGLYRYTWQSSSSSTKGVYRIDGYALSGNNTAQTIVQGSFRLV